MAQVLDALEDAVQLFLLTLYSIRIGSGNKMCACICNFRAVCSSMFLYQATKGIYTEIRIND